jgi:hypothetical protein
MDNVCILIQSSKTLFPMDVTELGIDMEARDMHPLNTPVLIDVSVVGIYTLDNLMQFWKA